MGNQLSIPIEQYEERIARLEEKVLELQQKVFLNLDDNTIRKTHHPHCVYEQNNINPKTYNGLPSSSNTAFATGQCADYITPSQNNDKNEN